MSRNYDVWLKYIDNDGNPLHGCVQFNVKDGNTQAAIFDSDGVALENPILTDEYGRTEHQVFIDDDVVAYFYKYIGSGRYQDEDDIDVSDVTKWSLQYTAESQLDVTLNITGQSPMGVRNILDLRGLNPEIVPQVAGYKIVTLLGYSTIGDKEPINYIWRPNNSQNDDGGSIIKYNDMLTGRWIMIPTSEHLDCRHFGVMPSNSINMSDQSSQIITFVQYCDSNRLIPLFSGDINRKYYKYSNITISVTQIEIAPGVQFVDSGSSSFTCEFIGDPYFLNHSTNLVTKSVKSSWNGFLITNPSEVIIDSEDNLYTTSFNDAEVHINVSIGTKVLYFTNCRVFVNKLLHTNSSFNKCDIFSKNNISSSCYFYGCDLDQNMFYGSPLIHVDNLCTIPLERFKNKLLMWKRSVAQQGKINYDWQGMPVGEDPWEDEIDTDRWLINFKSIAQTNKIKESSNPHTYFIENCAGTITLQGRAANTYVIKDSELVITLAPGFNEGSIIQLQNSQVTMNQTGIKLERISIQDSSIGGTADFDVTYAYVYNSILTADIRCGYCDVKDSNFSGNLNIYGIEVEPYSFVENIDGQDVTFTVSRFISGNIVNNFVNGTIEIGTIDYQDPHFTTNNLVRGLSIIDNVGIGIDPIVVHRSITNNYDEQNIYTYKGNTGTMYFRRDGITGVISDGSVTNEPRYAKMWDQIGVYGFTNTTVLPNSYLFKMRLFSIGTKNVKVNIHVEYNGMITGEGIAGADTGCTTYLVSEGVKSGKSMTKSQGDQFEWMIQNIPISVGMAAESQGDVITFNVCQLDRC